MKKKKYIIYSFLLQNDYLWRKIQKVKMKDYPDKMTVGQARVFGEDVLNIVSQIPCGKVTTYGHIAALAGWPSHSRMVGRTLRYSPQAGIFGRQIHKIL